jgi:solute carrier family 25 folate transporter 32
MLGAGLSWGGYFYFYEHAKQRWVNNSSRDGEPLPGALAWMAASVEAGTIMVALTNPIWLVKTRLQLQLHQAADQATAASASAATASKATPGGAAAAAPLAPPAPALASPGAAPARRPYTGFADAVATIVREEGVLALYKGSIPALLLVSHGAAQFVVYEALKGEFANQKNNAAPGTVAVLGMGAAAKIVASVATYPFQVRI